MLVVDVEVTVDNVDTVIGVQTITVPALTEKLDVYSSSVVKAASNAAEKPAYPVSAANASAASCEA